jgi:hypothetical protein
MFLVEAPPDTSAYMIAGYVIFFIIAAIYIISLLVRWRNLNQDMTMLEAIEKDNKSKAEKPSKRRKN